MEKNDLRVSNELLEIRPLVFTNDELIISELEKFQNQTIRPVLKYQNDLIVQLTTTSPNYKRIPKDSSRQSYEKAIGSHLGQPSIKYSLIGCVIGLFTSEELKFYMLNQKECNKRIHQMLIERVIDQTY
ncbi:MAG: glyoxalase [Bacteroidetes bacterium]|nr:glyoxalase [Bacteroidota bacterium]